MASDYVFTRSQQRKLVNFIEKHVSEEDRFIFNEGDEEYRMICPFCGGGRKRDYCMDFNIEKGVGHCWRQFKCNWRGSAFQFVMDLIHCDFQTALEVLGDGETATVEELIFELESHKDWLGSYRNDLTEYRTFDITYPNSVRLDESPLKDEIFYWIECERGYELESFLKQHKLFVPPQIGKSEGKVGFTVETEDCRAYQLYKFANYGYDAKTVNPEGQVLSRMFYNYNNVIDVDDVVFICEGIFDCARLLSWGLPAICMFGLTLQPYQVYLLSRLACKELVLVTDHGTNDKVLDTFKDGKRTKGLLTIISEFCLDKNVSFIEILKEGADPDDLSVKEFISYYDQRRGVFRGNNLDKLLLELDKIGKVW
ncbi:MAG: hypothetical protein CL489_16525 [Acidobacteria bacterium]|nr:hypothetical protein [Acidobacteriota bacterium]